MKLSKAFPLALATAVALLALTLGLRAASTSSADSPELREATKTVLSEVYTIDRKYRSMMGPYSTQKVKLGDGGEELVWITGDRADMVAADGESRLAQDFMCHSNLDIDVDAHMDVAMEDDAFRHHLRDAALDDVFFHLEVGNAVAEEAAGMSELLIDMNVVTGPRELLRGGKACRP